MDEQSAVNPGWKVSIIPHSAGNRTEPDVADPREVEAIIAGGAIQPSQPLESSELLKPDIPGLDPAPRYNANVPYAPPTINHSEYDLILIDAVRQAVKYGWKDAHRWANDAMTIGLEGEAVVKGMQRRGADVKTLIYDKSFAKAFFGEGWKDKLVVLIMSDNPMLVLKENLDVEP